MDLVKYVDHTILRPDASWKEVREVCQEAKDFSCASVCLAPCFVKEARKEFKDLRITTVVGFPLGYQTREVKEFETKKALEDGADEIDMVINISKVKDGDYDYLYKEIRSIKDLCQTRLVKVIVETCYLSKDEKVSLARLVEKAGADYIKTSTGFGPQGANLEDIKLFKKTCPELKIKAAGGISTLQEAQAFLNAGASRLGASRLVGL